MINIHSDFTPLVTIVTVSFNADSVIEQTIKSVLEQDYTNIEYIIIDGGSTDDTLKIINKYKNDISILISEPDNGIYDAMNKGIDNSHGHWINFLNAGDYFCNSSIVNRVINNLNKKSEIICGDIYYLYGDEKKYKKVPGLNSVLNGMFCFHQALFTRTDLLKKYKFNTQYKISGDYDFVLNCYKNNHNFEFLDFPMVTYLSGGKSETEISLARIEDLFIQSRYYNNADMLYNYNFSLSLNKIITQFDLINNNSSRIIIYGYGYLGKLLLPQVKNLIAIVDMDFENINNKNVLSPEILKKSDFDYVIICTMGREPVVEKYLADKLKIAPDKIIKFQL